MTKTVKYLTLLVLILVVSLPTAIFAQDEDAMETTTFEDENGLFTLEYPTVLEPFPNLFGEADETMIFPNYAFTTSEELNELSLAFEPVPEGEWGYGLLFFPVDMFAEMGMEEDATIADLAQVFMLGQFSDGDENLTEEQIEGMLEMMTIETVELEDGSEAAQIDLPGETEDNLVLLFEPADGVLALLSLLTAPGARTDEQIDAWLASANSLDFLGTAEDLFPEMEAE